MGIFSIILIALWVSTVFEGIYAIRKGYFHTEKEKVKKHERFAYTRWIKISGCLLVVCGLLNVIFSVLDEFSNDSNWLYIILIIATVVITITIIGIAYNKIVKPADKKAGIESEFDKIIKESKK